MGILKFHYFSTVDAHEMIVSRAFDKIGIVGLLIISEVDFVQQTSFDEKGDCPIHRCTRRAGLSFADTIPQFVGIEMLVGREDGFHDSIALRCITQPFALNKLLKARFNGVIHGQQPIEIMGWWRIGNFDIGIFLLLGSYSERAN